jgi:hypothetical protein
VVDFFIASLDGNPHFAPFVVDFIFWEEQRQFSKSLIDKVDMRGTFLLSTPTGLSVLATRASRKQRDLFQRAPLLA